MTIYFASGHGGYTLKNALLAYVHDELGYEVVDFGAEEFDKGDDYPLYIQKAAEAVSKSLDEHRAIILGGSGQGEAMVANRFRGVRAAVYYGEAEKNQIDAEGNELSILESTRLHNNANILSLGARFIGEDEAKKAVTVWLQTDFPGDARHVRRLNMLDKPSL